MANSKNKYTAEMDRQMILVLKPNNVNIHAVNINTKVFSEIGELISYVDENLKDVDSFVIYISDRHLYKLLESYILGLRQVKCVTFYCDSLNDMEKAEWQYSKRSSKFRFCLKTEVKNRIQNILDSDVLNSPLPVDRSHWSGTFADRRQEVEMKQQNLATNNSCNSLLPSADINKNHIDQFHQTPICDYCDEHFISANELKMHKRNDCLMIPRSCPLKNFGCSHPVPRAEIINHYLTEEHQRTLLAAVVRYLTISNRHNRSYATTSSSGDINAEAQLHEISDVLSGETEALNHDVQRLSNQVTDEQNLLDLFQQQFLTLKPSIQEHNVFLEEIQTNQKILQQDITSLKQQLDDNQSVSRDGTLIWKITNVQENMYDAQSERQTSIYSPAFYTSSTGYRMCSRLYLNGDGDARRTHMSLFFVLMCGEYDAILKFPFSCQVTFCLFDQTSSQRHIVDSFRPDIKSNSFQRPRSEMNIASGIPKFVPLAALQEENNPYIRDNTMFIKIWVDFSNLPRPLLPGVSSINPGLPQHIQHDIIRKMTAGHQRRRLRRTTASMRETRRIARSILYPSPSSAIQ